METIDFIFFYIEEDEKFMEDAIIAAAVGLGLAGIPGALVGFGAVGVNSLIKYINIFEGFRE